MSIDQEQTETCRSLTVNVENEHKQMILLVEACGYGSTNSHFAAKISEVDKKGTTDWQAESPGTGGRLTARSLHFAANSLHPSDTTCKPL